MLLYCSCVTNKKRGIVDAEDRRKREVVSATRARGIRPWPTSCWCSARATEGGSAAESLLAELYSALSCDANKGGAMGSRGWWRKVGGEEVV